MPKLTNISPDFKKDEIESIVRDLYTKVQNSVIIETLNKKGYRTQTGKLFLSGSMGKLLKDLNLKQEIKTEGEQIEMENQTTSEHKAMLTEQVKLRLIEQSIHEENNNLYTDSLTVADVFEKRHHSVLRDIENIRLELEQGDKKIDLNNFVETSYLDTFNRKQKKYLLTKKGLTLLVMGYTGSKALQFKLAYIDKFEEMENKLKQSVVVAPITNPLDMVQIMLDSLKAQSKQVNFLENKVNQIETKIDDRLNEITEQANRELSTFPKPSAEYEQMRLYNDPTDDEQTQTEVDRLVKTFANIRVLNPQVVYTALYNLYQSINHINIYLRATNENLRKIQWLRKHGKIKEFYSFVYKHLIENDGVYIDIPKG